MADFMNVSLLFSLISLWQRPSGTSVQFDLFAPTKTVCSITATIYSEILACCLWCVACHKHNSVGVVLLIFLMEDWS